MRSFLARGLPILFAGITCLYGDIIHMGDVGPTVPVDLDNIDEVNRQMEDLFSPDSITNIYDSAMSSNTIWMEEDLKDRQRAETMKSFTTKYAQRWSGKIKKETRTDIAFDKLVPAGRKIFFFGARDEDYPSLRFMRTLPKGSIGFCIDYETRDDLDRFGNAVEDNFIFQPLLNDDFLRELKVVKFYPCIITVESGKYEIQFGL